MNCPHCQSKLTPTGDTASCHCGWRGELPIGATEEDAQTELYLRQKLGFPGPDPLVEPEF